MAVLVLAGLIANPAAVDAGAPSLQLKPDKPLFWDAADLGGRRAGVPELCGIEGPCPEFLLDVSAPGGRLRIAVDHDNVDDIIELQLFAPGGTEPVAQQSTSNLIVGQSGANFQAAEVFAPRPALGAWRVRIVPGCAETCGPVRLRAKLERPQAAVRHGVLLLPNLRAEPPFDLVFRCRDDESAPPATTCLRFAFGPQNVGDGPLAFDFGPWDPVTTAGVARQRVYRSDATADDYNDNPYQDQAAQIPYALHGEHRHFHIDADAYSTQKLFRVHDRTRGTKEPVATVARHGMNRQDLEPAGHGQKTGFCLMDTGLARWTSFDQDPRTWTASHCQPPHNPPRMGISKGWRDIYFSVVHGNYVGFPVGGDGTPVPGLYVVQVLLDPKDFLVETDEHDNAGYAYIEVTESDVRVLERGQGLDPWDPRKSVCTDRGC